MKKFKIPVFWEMSGFCEVKANTIDEAIKIFDNTEDQLPLPISTEYYVDGSFKRENEEIISLNNESIEIRN